MILQAFNQTFEQVRETLPRLQKLGFSHVLISPPQKSHASTAWWARYQPVDYTVIEGLGDARALAELCAAGAHRGIAIVADAVLAHMSNEKRYVHLRGKKVVWAQYPRFSTPDFQPRKGDPHAPRLKTDSPYVRGQLKNYLHMLYGLGVRGFRFDAAKHIEPDFFAEVLRDLPKLLCFGEMVYARAQDFPDTYWQSMLAYDFPLARSVKTAFAPGGDLRQLLHPDALWGPLAVTFVNHHDLIKKRKDMAYFRIDDARDKELAYVYVLGRQDGLPLVYGGDLRSPTVKGAAVFHSRTQNADQHWLHHAPNQLVWRRGDTHLAALNKAGHEWHPGPLPTGLRPGRYRDLITGNLHLVDREGTWLTSRLPPRGAALLTAL